MLLKNKKRISTDRMLRFVSEKVGNMVDSTFLEIGKYAAFLLNDNSLLVGQILAFRYKTGKNKSYSLDYCPISEPSDTIARGIEVLCSYHQFKKTAENDYILFFIQNQNMSYYDIKTFFCHVNVILKKDNSGIDNLFLADSSKSKLENLLD